MVPEFAKPMDEVLFQELLSTMLVGIWHLISFVTSGTELWISEYRITKMSSVINRIIIQGVQDGLGNILKSNCGFVFHARHLIIKLLF